MSIFRLFGLSLCSLLLLFLPVFAQADEMANSVVKAANKTVNLVKDSAITGYIYTQIALDNNLSQKKINVSTDKGVVTLEGMVDSDSEASTLIQIASSAAGVSSVNATQLKIKKSEHPISDTIITAKVKGVLIRESLMKAKDEASSIHVETQNGVVYLSGTVDNGAAVQNAIKWTQSVSGVKRVESTIKVVSQAQ